MNLELIHNILPDGCSFRIVTSITCLTFVLEDFRRCRTEVSGGHNIPKEQDRETSVRFVLHSKNSLGHPSVSAYEIVTRSNT